VTIDDRDALAAGVVRDRSEQWLALLRRLAGRSQRWAVHGETAEGFSGTGDIDLVAPAEDWDALASEFVAWARACGLGAVVVCHHRQGAQILVALDPSNGPFYEMEVRALRYFKGWTAYRAADLVPLMVASDDGLRRLRPGAAGLLKLVPNGLTLTGGPKWSGAKLERVRRRLQADPEGVEAAAGVFGRVGPPVLTGARAVAAGGWDRRAMASAALRAALLAPTDVGALVARARLRLGRPRACPVLQAVAAGRVVKEAPATWLGRVERDHRVLH
jgi:hypothetical protein